MSIPGAPTLARGPIGRLRSPTTKLELNALRAAAWHRHGVAALAVDEIADPWLRQALINEATRRWGGRQGENTHGR
jgi:hypothetical protein